VPGALTVLAGTLTEQRWSGTELGVRALRAGDQAAFPMGWVHDVVNAEPSAPHAVADNRSACMPTHRR